MLRTVPFTGKIHEILLLAHPLTSTRWFRKHIRIFPTVTSMPKIVLLLKVTTLILEMVSRTWRQSSLVILGLRLLPLILLVVVILPVVTLRR